MSNEQEQSIMCLALVKPSAGALRERVDVDAPVYGIYEYDAGFGTRELRFGDGRWIAISPDELQDLILLPQFGHAEIEALFDY